MVDAGGAIPRGTEVPFHVGIEGEKLAVLVEGGIGDKASGASFVLCFEGQLIGTGLDDPNGMESGELAF